jgi:hypothetical protein
MPIDDMDQAVPAPSWLLDVLEMKTPSADHRTRARRVIAWQAGSAKIMDEFPTTEESEELMMITLSKLRASLGV